MLSTKSPRPLNLLAYDQQVISQSFAATVFPDECAGRFLKQQTAKFQRPAKQPDTYGGAG